ncbi:MAG: hypothetical protein ABSB35_19315 [Bryobacteraceae bacterium]
MVILIDIDGTICSEESPFDRPLARVFSGAVQTINGYKAAGHIVVFWTGRSWEQYRVTKSWLDDHGFQYDELIMGKPIANLIIDDRAQRFEGWHKDYLSNSDSASRGDHQSNPPDNHRAGPTNSRRDRLE